MSDTTDPILSERRGAVGLITINRPKTLNALNVDTLLALEAALTAFERDDALRALERLRRESGERLAEREASLARAADELRTAIEERERRTADLSAEADRMADAITDSAVRTAGLEEQLELRTAELASLRARHEDLAARMRTLESRSLVRAAVWLGGGEPPAEGRPTP